MVTALVVFGTTSLLAQSTIISNKTKTIVKTNRLISYELFTLDSVRDAAVDAAIKNVTYLKLNRQILEEIVRSSPAALSFSLPLNGTERTLVLGKTDIFTTDFSAQIRDESGTYRPASRPSGVFYHGYETTDDYSLAALSFFEGEMGGIISITGEAGNYNLTLNRNNSGAGNDHYLLYKEADIVNGSGFLPVCEGARQIEKQAISQESKHKAAGNDNGLSCNLVTLALYGDYKLYLRNNSSITGTQNYLTVLFNGLAALYENDGIRLALKHLSVNVANDYYSTTSSGEVLDQFAYQIQTNTTADVMQLVTGYTTAAGHPPLGGVAYLDMLCFGSQYFPEWDIFVGPFSIINTAGNPNLPTVPVYSWDINCSAHELGHNLGSPHTHDCVWNGNNTPIDGCGPTADIEYGDYDCPIGPIPSGTVKGTIMSYCHLLSGVGVSLANGFGPQPAALIKSRIAMADCLTPENKPDLVLSHADSVVYANAFCQDGNKLYCYDNRNDFDRSNDRLVLIIANNNIGSLNTNNVTISMATTPAYGTNTAADAAASVFLNGAYDAWYPANRSWKIQLGRNLPGETTYSFPFLQQDMNDLNGALPNYGAVKDSIQLVAYKTDAAATQPSLAPANDVKVYNYGTGNSFWNYATTWTYKMATVKATTPVRGATLAVGKLKTPTGIHGLAQTNSWSIYPNPAKDQLHCSFPESAGSIRKIEIMDYVGKVVRLAANPTQEHTFDVGNLPAGIYLVRCVTAQGIWLNKFVKE